MSIQYHVWVSLWAHSSVTKIRFTTYFLLLSVLKAEPAVYCVCVCVCVCERERERERESYFHVFALSVCLSGAERQMRSLGNSYGRPPAMLQAAGHSVLPL